MRSIQALKACVTSLEAKTNSIKNLFEDPSSLHKICIETI
jgi:hypothetical protein